MIPSVSVENMRDSDAYTIAHFTPGSVLMHRAAYGVYLSHEWKGSVGILVGSGNNGGDGYALACILDEHNIPCTIIQLSSRISSDSAVYAQEAAQKGIPIEYFYPDEVKKYDILVDCLLGTGFQGPVRQEYRAAIEAINASEAFVISVDINSGMNGDTGEAEIAVESDLTVTIGYVKHGLITDNAARYMKRLVCADIGIRLLHEEHIIYSTEELIDVDITDDRYILCPGWLDMNVICAK